MEGKKVEKTEVDENIQAANNNEIQLDPFTQLMFGTRIPKNKQETTNSASQQEGYSNFQEYMVLMEQFEEIMKSLNNLKPIINELTPLLKFFKKTK